jgi:hypothetical protein
MTTPELCYSNTIIYKIYCNDASINDIYIGHTTNFIQRKCQHKASCGNLKNQLKLYNIIRENGGWNNWNMVEIAKYNCKDKTEARIKEQYHYEELNATLNSCPPFVNNKNKDTSSLNDKIIVQQCPNHTEKFYCHTCNFKCSKLSDYNRHLITRKHTNLAQKYAEALLFTCKNCNKQFKHSPSLSRHKKTCCPTEVINNINTTLNEKELIITLLNQNNQLQNQIIELYKENTSKNFNLQVF